MTITNIYRIVNKNIFLAVFFILMQLLHIKIIPIRLVLAICSESLGKEIYSHYSEKITINLYNIIKNNRFKITSDHIQYLNDEKIIWFIRPEILIYLKNNIPIWKISCDQAKLIQKNIFDLYGYVHINRIINNKSAESIITKQVLINLIDQNMISNDTTIIHGYCFYSIGSKMYVDFKIQKIELFGKIYTQYEIK